MKIAFARLAAAAAAVLGMIAAAPSPAPLAPLHAAMYGDFQHYTLALTWTPGWCSTGPGCLADQPHSPLIGIHGLWPSRPKKLIDEGMTDPAYWGKGCDALSHSSEAPSLDPNVAAQLGHVMPHNHSSLLNHEYDKHAQCFGFDTNLYFKTEMALRDRINDSAFGAFLISQAGKTASHAAIVEAFDSAFAVKPSASPSLQLQCEHDVQGRTILTQVWFTIHAESIDAFPAASSMMDTDPNQDTCPASFYVPSW